MEDPKTYKCSRCGEESDYPPDVRRGYCAFCGVHAEELAQVDRPASPRARAPSSDRLLPCV